MASGILTLQLDPDSFAYFTGLRSRHFPPERNYLSAHVTLFHALPLARWSELEETLLTESRAFTPFALTFSRPLFLGAGTAIAVEAAPLLALRARLATHFAPWLTPQDRQGFRPHVTIQNKVGSRVAKNFFAEFSARWHPKGGRADGLDLWEYEGGPWRHLRTYPFAGERATSSYGTTPSPS